MDESIKPVTHMCPETGAMVFSTPKFVKDQRKLQEENSALKAMLAELVRAQSAAVRSKLSQELLDLSQEQ